MYPICHECDLSGYGSIQRLAVHQTIPYVQYNLDGYSLPFIGDARLSLRSHTQRM
jgi:hypothetical protein